jgi:enoyl-CoA hydratase
MTEQVLLIEKSSGIATITLNRPESMNALSKELRQALASAYQDINNDRNIRVIILTGAGKAFCAGLDLKELSEKGLAERKPSSDVISKKGFSAPVIAAINGPAITGGFELALSCDILIASTNARFADTHARVGYIPGGGISQILSRVIGPYRAKEISLTGNFISAEQAYTWGLVNRIVEPDELMPTCMKIAQDILSCVPEVLDKYKDLIDDGFNMTLSEGLQLERQIFTVHAQTVTADAVSQRRTDIIKRGRDQKNKETKEI